MSHIYASPGDPLSERELEVLLAIADGQDTNAIADELFIAANTVNHHVKSLLVKLDARNRAHAVALAYHRRLLIVPELASAVWGP